MDLFDLLAAVLWIAGGVSYSYLVWRYWQGPRERRLRVAVNALLMWPLIIAFILVLAVKNKYLNKEGSDW